MRGLTPARRVSSAPVANRILVVGWDGADWDILDPLLAAGELPHLARLIERGRRGVSRSCTPSHSWAAWPTFLTGRDPAGHGVFDILEHQPGASRRMPVSSRSILAPTWPERLSQAGRRVVIANIPLTYPAPAVNGVAIAGGVIPGGATFSHPPEIGPSLGWPINGGSWTTFRGRPLDLVEDVERTSVARAEAMRRLLDSEEWDAACLVFVSPDRIQHCLLEYVHPGHPRHAEAVASPVADRVRDVYRMLDRELGTLVERTDDEDTVVLMSDHGHQPCTRALNMNRVLEHLGHLRLGRGSGLVGLLAWGRLRSIARVAYDKLGLHGRVAVRPSRSTGRPRSPTRASSRPARASRSRFAGASRTGGSHRRTTSGSATRWPRRCSASPTPRPARTRSGAVRRKEDVLDGPTSTGHPTCCSRRPRSTPSPTPAGWSRKRIG